MKLRKSNYLHPVTKAVYNEMFVEEKIGLLDRFTNYLKVDFIMYHIYKSQKYIISETFMTFQGLDFGEGSTNQTMMCLLAGESTAIPMLPVLQENDGVLPEGAIITNIGYPNFADVQLYFNGGSIQSPEIIVENPLAKLFVLKKCIMNGETLEKQGFTFV